MIQFDPETATVETVVTISEEVVEEVSEDAIEVLTPESDSQADETT